MSSAAANNAPAQGDSAMSIETQPPQFVDRLLSVLQQWQSPDVKAKHEREFVTQIENQMIESAEQNGRTQFTFVVMDRSRAPLKNADDEDILMRFIKYYGFRWEVTEKRKPKVTVKHGFNGVRYRKYIIYYGIDDLLALKRKRDTERRALDHPDAFKIPRGV
jgi:hypothetical protein